MAIYEPLAPKQIRLLFLSQKNSMSNNQICATLKPFNIDHAPPYEALSYVWGDNNKTSQIKVNSTPQKVTDNLLSALTHFQLESESRTLWIDALCIEQDNTTEKSQQVRMMRQIFSKAAHVILWLGADDESTPVAFQAIDEVTDTERPNHHKIALYPQIYLGDAIQRDKQLAEGQDYYEPPQDDFTWFSSIVDRLLGPELAPPKPDHRGAEHKCRALSKLLDRAYFRRVWILQEITVSQNATFFCGRFNMSCDKFYDALAWFWHHNQTIRFGGVMLSQVSVGLLRLQMRKQDFAAPLSRLLQMARKFHATDARDKGFALVGISKQNGDPNFAPDYALSLDDVNESLTRHLIVSEKNLDILSLASAYPPDPKRPSWVLDLSLNEEDFDEKHVPVNNQGFKASRSAEPVVFDVGNPKILALRGLRFDRVKQVVSTERLVDSLSTSIIQDIINKIWGLFAELQVDRSGEMYRFTGESIQDVYVRTLTGDRHQLSTRVQSIPRGLYEGRGMRPHDLLVLGPQTSSSDLWETIERMLPWILNYDIIVTNNGCLGIAKKGVEEGDTACILLGGEGIFMLHSQGDGQLRLVGDCYIHGFMDGEAFVDVEEDLLEDISIH